MDDFDILAGLAEAFLSMFEDKDGSDECLINNEAITFKEARDAYDRASSLIADGIPDCECCDRPDPAYSRSMREDYY